MDGGEGRGLEGGVGGGLEGRVAALRPDRGRRGERAAPRRRGARVGAEGVLAAVQVRGVGVGVGVGVGA